MNVYIVMDSGEYPSFIYAVFESRELAKQHIQRLAEFYGNVDDNFAVRTYPVLTSLPDLK